MRLPGGPWELALALALTVAAGCAPRAGGHPRPMTAFEARNRAVASATLRQLLTLQATYREMYGAYAGSLAELQQVGWEEGRRGQMIPRIVHHRRRLCLAMLPRVRSLPAWSMGADRRLHRGAYCGRPW